MECSEWRFGGSDDGGRGESDGGVVDFTVVGMSSGESGRRMGVGEGVVVLDGRKMGGRGSSSRQKSKSVRSLREIEECGTDPA